MSKYQDYLLWAARIIASLILLQTLYFKFTGASESVYIFSKLGVEPWGRIGSGVVELVAGILLLVPSLSWLGAAIAIGVMSGAILSHLTVLGIDIQGDGGYLFALAVIVAICSSIVIILQKNMALAFVKDVLKRF